MARKRWFADPAVWLRVQIWSVAVLSAAIPLGKFPAEASIVIGLLAWFIRLGLERRQPEIPGGPVNTLLLVWLAAAALSCANSIDMMTSINGLRKLVKVFAAYLLVADTVRSREALDRALAGAFIGLVITLADCGWQAVFGVDLFYRMPHGVFGSAWRISGPFGHAADLGIHLVTVCPIVLALALRGRPAQRRPLFVLAVTTSVFVMLCMARGATLAFVGSMLLLSALMRHWLPAALGLGIGAFQAATVPADIRAWSAHEPDWLHRLTQPERLDYWQAALRMIKAHPFIGVGVNTFVLAYPAYRIAGDHYGLIGPYAHNQYLHLAAEIGLIGLSAFLLLLVALGLSVRRGLANRAPEADRALAAGLGAGLAAFLINGLLESSLFYGRGSLLFWWMAGLIVAAGAHTRRR